MVRQYSRIQKIQPTRIEAYRVNMARCAVLVDNRVTAGMPGRVLVEQTHLHHSVLGVAVTQQGQEGRGGNGKLHDGLVVVSKKASWIRRWSNCETLGLDGETFENVELSHIPRSSSFGIQRDFKRVIGIRDCVK